MFYIIGYMFTFIRLLFIKLIIHTYKCMILHNMTSHVELQHRYIPGMRDCVRINMVKKIVKTDTSHNKYLDNRLLVMFSMYLCDLQIHKMSQHVHMLVINLETVMGVTMIQITESAITMITATHGYAYYFM